MQTANEVGKYVTDGKKVYPYNMYLDDLLANGTLQFCNRPENVKNAPKPVYRTPVGYTAEERLAFAQKLDITLGELTNMSPQEFEAAMVSIEDGSAAAKQVAATSAATDATGFPA